MQKGRISLFGPIIISCRIELIFGWRHEKHRCVIAFVDLRFVFEKQRMQKTKYVERETQKTFCFFITYILTLISYCCYAGTSEWGVERIGFEFVLSWHRFDTRWAIFFPVCFSTPFKNQNIYLKKSVLLKLLEVLFMMSSRLHPPWYDSLLKTPLVQKDSARKTAFFAYVISRTRSADQQKQLQNDAFYVQTSQCAKH